MNGRKMMEDHPPLEFSDKRDITLKTALLLYPKDERFSRWFLLDLFVLLFMFLLFMYVQSPERSLFKVPISPFFSHWFGQERFPKSPIDRFNNGLAPGSRGTPRVLMGNNRLLVEAGPYLTIISDAAAANHVAKGLILAVIKVESGFDPGAVSSRGAMGLMQLMPLTAKDLGVRDPFDPEENIHGGVAYLSYCLRRFEDVELALAAYNAGPGIVSRLKCVPPYQETRNFVARVLRHRARYDAVL